MKDKTYLKLLSSGRYVPPAILSNFDLEKIVETSDEWIFSHTGIRTRHIAKEEKTSDLATKAALNALEKSKIKPEDLDLIIVATITGETTTPSMANLVQAKLGIADRQIMCFDVNAACTGFIYGLQVASALLNTNQFKKALLIGVESMSKVIDYTDRNTCILFGDGAGAVILEKGSRFNHTYFFTSSMGDIEETLTVNQYLKMNGRKVYRFAVTAIKDTLLKTFHDLKLKWQDFKKIIIHQANMRITESVAETMNIPIEHFYSNLERYGNTSAASIPLALDEYLENNQTAKGDKILLVGFGGGLTWGSSVITL